MGKKSSSGPDVVGAASTEGKYAREIAREGSYADRPDQFNPFGSSTWGQEQVMDPASGEMVTKWSQNQQLNQQSQNLLDSEMRNNQQLSNAQGTASARAAQEMSQPLNFGQFGDVDRSGIGATTGAGEFGWDSPNDYNAAAVAPTTGDGEFTWDSSNRQRAEDDAYGRSTSRLDPRFAEQRATMETQMANRGLRAGDSAYDKAMGNFGRTENDAYEQARMGATSEGRGEDQQAFGQAQNAWNTNRNTDQQAYNQAQGAYGTNRGVEQQQFDQGMQSNERSNALRQKQIDEYLGKRGQSLSEAERLGQAKNYQEVTNAFGGGS